MKQNTVLGVCQICMHIIPLCYNPNTIILDFMNENDRFREIKERKIEERETWRQNI